MLTKGEGQPMSDQAAAEAVHGSVDAGYDAVRAAFEENFRTRGDTGAALSVYRDGRQIVDLWGGESRPGQPWAQDTLVCAMSTVKPVLATAVAMLVDRGQLDFDAPIADVWPEFAAAGKERITTAQVLTHTAGLETFHGHADVVSFDDPASFARWDEIVDAIAQSPAQGTPGVGIASHSITVGWLLGEIVRRASGVPIGEFVRREISEPLGVDVWIGVPADQQERAADMITDPGYDSDELYAFMNPDTPQGHAFLLGPERRLGTALRKATNDPTYRAAGNPAAGAFVTPRSLARIYAMLLNGGELDGTRLLSEDIVRRQTTIREEGLDELFQVYLRLSLGFLHASRDTRYGSAQHAFGFPGQGGQLAFGDPETGIAFCYIPARIAFLQGEDPRAAALIEAVYACG
jgi:CubicO group peptidase (beta-lactamase class C family)